MRVDNDKLFHDGLDQVDNSNITRVFKISDAFKSAVKVTALSTKLTMEL